METIKSKILSKIPGLVHGFGTYNEPVPQVLHDLWDSKRPVWKQVHGCSFAQVLEPKQPCGDVDALWTAVPEIPVAVTTADCVPILMANLSASKVVAIHAGWRGTKSQIVRKVWDQLARFGEAPKNWVAAIGPAIGPCCYEVSNELAEDFVSIFKRYRKEIIVPRYRILDLPAVNACELEDMGFSDVEVLRYCTRCSRDPLFHSFRRDGRQDSGPVIGQWSGLRLMGRAFERLSDSGLIEL